MNQHIDKASICLTVSAEEDGMTARGALRRARGISQRLVRKIVHGEGEGAGALYINGKPAGFRDKVRTGDEIRLVFPEEESWIEPENIPIDILYEDDDILAINKQPGLVVHPTKGHREGTIAGAVIYHMRQSGESYKPRFISRLDMDTSGVLLIGKNSHAQDSLAKQAASGGVGKYYMAVIEGRLEDDMPPRGIIDLPIGLERQGEPRRAVLALEEGGYPSQTEYEVVAVEKDRQGETLTIVRVRLITGRTHQIRVHFSHLGHPVLGDHLYGRPTQLIARQALHATKISFEHPANGTGICIKAPIPQDMAVFASETEQYF